MKSSNEQYIWVVAYVDKDHIVSLQKDLNKCNQYIGVEAQLPKVKILKKKFKNKEDFDEVPLLFNYGFFKIPILWAMSADLLDRIKKDIACISHWVKDPAKIFITHSKADLTKDILLGSRDVPYATVSSEQVAVLVKFAQEESIHSSEEIDELKEGSLVTLMGYPFEGMEAKVLFIDKKHKKVKVALKLDMGLEEEDIFSDMPIDVHFDNIFYSIYRGAYHEDYNKNKEKPLSDFKFKTQKSDD